MADDEIFLMMAMIHRKKSRKENVFSIKSLTITSVGGELEKIGVKLTDVIERLKGRGMLVRDRAWNLSTTGPGGDLKHGFNDLRLLMRLEGMIRQEEMTRFSIVPRLREEMRKRCAQEGGTPEAR